MIKNASLFSLLRLSLSPLGVIGGMALSAGAQTMVPGENLTIEGIPPLPAALVESVGRYTEFRTAGFSDWHPKKREMLIATRFADTTQAHLLLMPGGARTQMTFFADSVGGASFQPTEGDYFLFTKDAGGNEFAQIYRYDLKNGAVTLLTDGKSQNGGARWSHAGDRIAYTSTRRNGRDRDIYVMNPRDPKTDKIAVSLDGSWSVSDWSPDDRTLILGNYLSVNESYLWLLDLVSGQKTLLTPRNRMQEPFAYSGARFAPDGKGFYTTTDRDGEFRQLAYVNFATRTHRYLTPDIPWDVESFDLSPDGKTIVFTTNENGVSALHLRDAATGKEKKTPQLPLGIIGGVSFRPDGKEIAFTLTSARSPSDVYSFAPGSSKIERWTYSETGGLPAETFSEPTLAEWKAPDGKNISGFLYRPDPIKFPGKRPVIINIHGGPESQSRPGFIGRTNYYLSELGVAVLFPNVRGSTGFGKTFVKLDNGMLREGTYTDINALFDWVAKQPDLDANRVMVTGGSYGGHMTLALATRYPDRIACSLAVVGISNFITFLERTEAYRRDLRRAEYGDEREPEMRAYFEKTAPLNNAGKVRKPLFIVQGKNDPRVPYTEAIQMKEAVQKNNVPVWFLMASDEGHGFAKKKNLDFQFYATIQFIREYLLK